MSSWLARYLLFSCAPVGWFSQRMSYSTPSYLPECGRYFSSRCSSRTSGPPVAQLMVVSCVPIATRILSAAPAGAAAHTSASARQGSWRWWCSVSTSVFLLLLVAAATDGFQGARGGLAHLDI